MDDEETYESLVGSTIGVFLEGELAAMLNADEALAKEFWEEYSECDGCGRIWRCEDLEEPEGDDILDGLYCFYCVE